MKRARKSTGGAYRYSSEVSSSSEERELITSRKSTGGVSRYPRAVSSSPEERKLKTARKSTGGISRYSKVKSRKPEERDSDSKPVLESHLDLLNQGNFSDVTFIVGEGKERISCHQLFLKARSPVFAKMFSEGWNNQDTGKEIPLEHVRPETFKQFLEFVYADTFEAEELSEALELLHLAHKFDVKLLISECEEVLESEVTLDEALQVFQAARAYELEKLMDKVGELWTESLSEMEANPWFPQLDKQALSYILTRKDLKIEEVDLFRLALDWARNQTDSTAEESLEDILPLIRFPIMSLEDFTATVVPTKLLPPSKVIEIFTYFGSDRKTRKTIARSLGFRTQERHEDPASVDVSLYPTEEEDNVDTQEEDNVDTQEEDNVDTESKLQVSGELKECIQLCNLQMQPQLLIRGIGLSGVSVYCPTATNSKSSASRRTSETFHIRVKSKDCRDCQFDLKCDQNYRKVLKMYDVRVRQGEAEDVEFDTVIPLKKETIYSIEIEDVWNSNDGDMYVGNSMDFGAEPTKSVTVNIDNICGATLDVHRNILKGFEQEDSELTGPRLIYKLRFEEL